MAQSPSQLHVIDHPVIAHLLTVARNRETPSPKFRDVLGLIARFMAYEVTRDLPTEPTDVTTPLETMQGTKLKLPVTIVPILRAGLGMAEGIWRLLPQANMGHLGMFRDEDSLEPVSYYARMPENIAEGPVLLVDPMLATGGSAVAACKELRDRGCNDIRLICLVVAPEGVQKMADEMPDVPIYAAALDRELNDIGYILPGLGDAGDRVFGT